jgi:hypothetical protein
VLSANLDLLASPSTMPLSVSYRVSEKVLTSKTPAYRGRASVKAQRVEDLIWPGADLLDQLIKRAVRPEQV